MSSAVALPTVRPSIPVAIFACPVVARRLPRPSMAMAIWSCPAAVRQPGCRRVLGPSFNLLSHQTPASRALPMGRLLRLPMAWPIPCPWIRGWIFLSPVAGRRTQRPSTPVAFLLSPAVGRRIPRPSMTADSLVFPATVRRTQRSSIPAVSIIFLAVVRRTQPPSIPVLGFTCPAVGRRPG